MATRPQIDSASVLAAYLLRGLARRIDYDRIGRDRRRSLTTEFGDFLVPAAVSARSTLEWCRLVCDRFEISPAGEGWEGGDGREHDARAAYAVIPKAFVPPDTVLLEGHPKATDANVIVRWDHACRVIGFDALRIALNENPALYATFALTQPVDGEEQLFTAWGASPEVKPWTPTLPSRLITPRAYRTIWTLISPLAHGHDHKSGNVTLFRRERRVDPVSGLQYLTPFISGNATRGAWRDKIFSRLLRLIGLKTTEVPKEMIHALLAGGAIESGADGGTVNVAARRRARAMSPAWDLFAGCIEQQIMAGLLRIHDAVLVCRENAWMLHTLLEPRRIGSAEPMSFAEFRDALEPADNLTQLRLLTRHAHRDLPGSEGTQMITQTEVILPGAMLVHSFQLIGLDGVSELAGSCMRDLLDEFAGDAFVGAQNARGLGRVAFDPYVPGPGHAELPGPEAYLRFVEENKAEIRAWLLREEGVERTVVAGVPATVTKGAKGRRATSTSAAGGTAR
jgi:hypothetical protein